MKAPRLFVVRKLKIYVVQSSLGLIACHGSSDQSHQISTSVPHHHNLTCAREFTQDLILNRLRRNVMTRAQNDQVFDTTDDFPISIGIYLALVTCVKPAVPQYFCCFFRTMPVSWKNIRAPNY